MSKIWRLHHTGPIEGPGQSVVLESTEAHHAARVLRLRPGDPMAIFDGHGREWSATIASCDRSGTVVRVVQELLEPVEPPLTVRLYQGRCRADRMEWLIQKATELGVTSIHSVVCERGETRRVAPQRLRRWQRIAVEACKQSGRRRVPTVECREKLPPAGGSPALMCAPGSASTSLAEALVSLGASDEVWLAVGPESGFDNGELERSEASGWQPVSLGPRTLRAETAALVAVAVVLHCWGDLGRGPGGGSRVDSPSGGP